MSVEHFDVLIVGAGISGIGAGYHLQARCPGKRYAILEGRSDIGGTWDLFRYPGIRSDSDMFTLGYSFRPWKQAKSIADGPSIREYLRETAREHGIDQHIRFNHRVRSASWSSEEARWTIEADVGASGERVRYTCSFLYLCSGYYSYEGGYTPRFPGLEDYQGRVVHPQKWPEDLDYRGKRVVVIGSGATAVTLVPSMAADAEHVTMLQRSPSYIASLPAEDPIANAIRKLLPERAAHSVARWKNVTLGTLFYQLCRRAPGLAKRMLRSGVVKELPPEYDVDTHFQPSYQPWDQRLCLVPDADLFRAIKAGRASVVTDRIRTFTKNGILLESGKELQADVIVTATGLQLQICGGIQLSVDGEVVEPSRTLVYKGMMLGNVPNLALCVGYTNASWTLRAELSSKYVCRLLNHMDRNGYRQCLPRPDESTIEQRPLLGLTSGYVQRALDHLPKQGSKAPWYLRQNYMLDRLSMQFGPVDDGTMMFSKAGQPPRRDAPKAARHGHANGSSA
ncbi:flavin-containing monooxygenase [Polyangium aurulentum]|uniref:flavin-containing monooxygenase n=1 Tax=Polyangium aurulentum TaxID=2567896 RepID=UPI0010ADEFEE|nr:NAD(P)/FAD-dependent oxidoreductase [Polyangium aurulentum]UQA59806.1 NAD(P)/FAD-dependent oxidoreductase [Polyangium aurulentum]